MRWTVTMTLAAAAGLLGACAMMPPDATERADGTILYCPNDYNVHHVLRAARARCAPEPAQFVGRASCGEDTLAEGPVVKCGHNPDYDPVTLEDVDAAANGESETADAAADDAAGTDDGT